MPKRDGSAARLWLPHLTGLRGLAALWVAIHHMFNSVYMVNGALTPTPLSFMFFGHLGVAVFLVVSGYCLMMPIAAHPQGRPSSGWLVFYWRRVKRIIPAYYLMIGVSLGAIALFPNELDDHMVGPWWNALPISWEAVRQHLLLIHNLTNMGWKVDYPMWSIGTEFQIYFAMPIIVLMWRRWGALAALLLLAPFGFIPYCHNMLGMAKFHLLTDFLLGVVAADVVHRPRPDGTWWKRVPWLCISLVLWIGLLVATTGDYYMDTYFSHEIESDIAVGAATGTLLMYLGLKAARPPWLGRVLGSPIPYNLGLISYSLYLMHAPVIAFIYAHSHLWGFGDMYLAHFAFLVVTALPPILVLSYLLFLVGEKPFLPRAEGLRPLTAPRPAAGIGAVCAQPS